jgi:hypothetical protein
MVGVLLSESSIGTSSHVIHGSDEDDSRPAVFHTVTLLAVRAAILEASIEYTTFKTDSSLTSCGTTCTDCCGQSFDTRGYLKICSLDLFACFIAGLLIGKVIFSNGRVTTAICLRQGEQCCHKQWEVAVTAIHRRSIPGTQKGHTYINQTGRHARIFHLWKKVLINGA